MLQWIKHLSRLCTFLSSLSIVLIDFYGLESFGFHFKHGKNAQKLFCDVASQATKEGLKCHLFVSLYNLEDMSVLGDHWYTQNIRILADAPLACFVFFSHRPRTMILCFVHLWCYTHATPWLYLNRISRRITTKDRPRGVVFTVRVIHSLPLRQSVVQVYHGDRMMAISHLIGTEQLPRRKQVRNWTSDWSVAFFLRFITDCDEFFF